MSKIIKSQWAQPTFDEQKIISIKMFQSMKKEDSIEMNLYDLAKQQELLNQAYSEAEMIVSDAKEQAQRIHEQILQERNAWEQEKLNAIEAAKREGFLIGTNEGRNQGYMEYHEKILFAQEIINSAKKDYESHVGLAEKTILEVGMNAAEKILGEKLREGEEWFLAIVKKALKEARDSREVQIHVHPRYFDYLISRKDELTIIFPKETNLYIYPNDELSESSCFIESANGRIDASVDSQLEELKRKLFELLESES